VPSGLTGKGEVGDHHLSRTARVPHPNKAQIREKRWAMFFEWYWYTQKTKQKDN